MQNPSLYDQTSRAAEFIAARTSLRPSIAVVLGSGLGGASLAQIKNDRGAPLQRRFRISRSPRRPGTADVFFSAHPTELPSQP